jgi:hypothetical protein
MKIPAPRDENVLLVSLLLLLLHIILSFTFWPFFAVAIDVLTIVLYKSSHILNFP